MKKLTLTVVLAGVLLLAVISSNLYAVGYGHDKGAWGGHGAPGLALTPEQTGKMKELRDAHWKEVAPLRDKLFSKSAELKLLWVQANPDRDKINAVQKEMRGLRDKMQDQMTSYRLDMLKILTPEQQARFQAAKAGYGHRPGFGGECGGGMRKGMMQHPGSHGSPHMDRCQGGC